MRRAVIDGASGLRFRCLQQREQIWKFEAVPGWGFLAGLCGRQIAPPQTCIDGILSGIKSTSGAGVTT